MMDHRVDVESGKSVHVPLRIIENCEGCEVLLTLFRQPGMNDEHFDRDARWVRRDLEKLKQLAENRAL